MIITFNIYSDNDMYLTVDSLIDINNIISGLKNIILRKVNVKLYGFDKIYMDEYLIKDKLFQLINPFSMRKISHEDVYIHPLYDGNGRTCKILLYLKDFNVLKMLVVLTHFNSFVI